jgi:hypothetical protein
MKFRLALVAVAVALITTACFPRATFTPMDHPDPESGVHVFYAMPDAEGWRQAGSVRVEDATSEWDAERRALALAARHRCDGVYLASVQSHVETSGTTLLAELAAIGGGRRARENAERANRRDQENPVFTARAVCLVRRPVPDGPALAFARPDAPAASVATEIPRAVPAVDVQSHLGERVTLRFADGRHQTGTLAGDDGESVFLRTEGATLRFPAAHVSALEAAPQP